MDTSLLRRNNTDPKQGFSFIVSVNNSHILTRFNPPLQLRENKSYGMALVNLERYFSIPNIHVGNNTLRYSPDEGTRWFTITRSTGSYGIDEINDEIQRQLRLRCQPCYAESHSDPGQDLPGEFQRRQQPQQRAGVPAPNLHIRPRHQRLHGGQFIVNIISINSILVHSDIISGSYVNGSQKSVIYNFFSSFDHGMKIFQKPRNLVYLPVTSKTVNRMQTYLTDQDGRPIDLRGEHLTIRFYLREV